ADRAGDHGEHQVHRADVLVVRRVNVAAPSGRMIVRVVRVRVGGGVHGQSPSTLFFALLTLYCVAAGTAATAVGARSSRANFFFASSTHLANSASLTTRTAIGMKAWSRPQSSEHCP